MSMRVPADAAYPAEDDYTEALLKIQLRSPEDGTGGVQHTFGTSKMTIGLPVAELHPDRNRHVHMMRNFVPVEGTDCISADTTHLCVLTRVVSCMSGMMCRNQGTCKPTLKSSSLRQPVMMAYILLADFSMTSFCSAVARTTPDPLQRGRVSPKKRKQPHAHGNPEAYRLFSLRLESISAGIAARASSCANTGAKCSMLP
jgi:hypothetical protein